MQVVSLIFVSLYIFLAGRQTESIPIGRESHEIGRPISQHRPSIMEGIALKSSKKGKPYVIQKRSPIVTMTRAEMQAIREHNRGRSNHRQKVIEENAAKWHREHKD